MSNKYQVRIYRPMFGSKGGPDEIEHYHAATLLGVAWILLTRATVARSVAETRIFPLGSPRAV